MIHPREITGDGKHLCMVCHDIGAINISPLPGQNTKEGLPDSVDVCAHHAAVMCVGALMNTHGPAAVVKAINDVFGVVSE